MNYYFNKLYYNITILYYNTYIFCEYYRKLYFYNTEVYVYVCKHVDYVYHTSFPTMQQSSHRCSRGKNLEKV